MTSARRSWEVRLAAAAEADIRDILRWTADRFGEGQTQAYAATIAQTLAALADGPIVAGARARDDILPGLMTLHVARKKHRGRHLVVFRVSRDAKDVIEVLRVLHDAMELRRHLPPLDDDADR